MATVHGTVQEAFAFTEAEGPGAATVKVMNCRVNVTYPTGTYASAGNADFAPATVIQNERRNGKTVTILQACFAGAGDENGTVIGAGACVNTSGTVAHELTQADLTTERADGAMSATWNKPITFCVTFTETK